MPKSLEEISECVGTEASTDGASEIMQEFASQNRKVTLTRSSALTGKGVLYTGTRGGNRRCSGIHDADWSIHPDDFMRLVDR